MAGSTKFKPGQSGNPSGRPKGSRHKTTLAIEELLDGEAEEITRKAIEKAKDGDTAALRICLDRLSPPRKDRHIELSMPKCISGHSPGCFGGRADTIGGRRAYENSRELRTHAPGVGF
jgi:uncharacterized protein DUF5681